MAAKAITVKGPVEPDELGKCLMHEHLFCDLTWWSPLPEGASAAEASLWDEKLTLENLHLARDRKPIRDNFILTDEGVAIDEVQAFRASGGGTIVDVTNIGLGRDPLALSRVADATGLHSVMGSGWYQKASHPPNVDQRTPEDLADEIIRDITVGVGDTGIRSGIIGEVGINGNPITPNEEKSLRATAWASRATGAAISLHYGGMGHEKFEVATLLREEGADPTRTIFGHSGAHAGDLPFLIELLNLGVYVQFDQLGRPVVPLARHPADPILVRNAPEAATDVLVAEAIPRLIEAGFGDRILLSHDVCFKTHLRAYGGTGYSQVLDKFVPYLLTQDVTKEQANKILVENPEESAHAGGARLTGPRPFPAAGSVKCGRLSPSTTGTARRAQTPHVAVTIATIK